MQETPRGSEWPMRFLVWLLPDRRPPREAGYRGVGRALQSHRRRAFQKRKSGGVLGAVGRGGAEGGVRNGGDG